MAQLTYTSNKFSLPALAGCHPATRHRCCMPTLQRTSPLTNCRVAQNKTALLTCSFCCPPSLSFNPQMNGLVFPVSPLQQHIARRLQDWPRPDDGSLRTCDKEAADIRRNCDYIAHVRAFSMRWLKQLMQQRPAPQPFPLRLTRALYAAAPAGAAADGDSMTVLQCEDVTAARRTRLRCNHVARMAVRLAAIAGADQGVRQLCG
jgi:hypothetical protein